MNSNIYKVEDHEHLVKNIDNKSILNVDAGSLNKYREERDKSLRLSSIVRDNARLNKEVVEIKQTLSEILELLRNKT